MKVLVCGGREFDDWQSLDNYMVMTHAAHQIEQVIQGGAKGADFLARVWAKCKKIPCVEYPADWKQHGKAAGGIRNQQMLDEGRPDLVIAFPGGSGTGDMVRRSIQAGVRVERPLGS